MKINVQVENDNKGLSDSIASSMKDRTNMLKEVLAEMRRMHTTSMDKMMSMMKKMQPADNSSFMVNTIKEVMSQSRKTNSDMVKSIKSIVDKKKDNNDKEITSVIENSNSLLKAMQNMVHNSSKKEKPVVIKTIRDGSIDNLAEAIKSGFSRNRERWSPSAS